MSRSVTCDRCGAELAGPDLVVLSIVAGIDYGRMPNLDMCAACWADFGRWLGSGQGQDHDHDDQPATPTPTRSTHSWPS